MENKVDKYDIQDIIRAARKLTELEEFVLLQILRHDDAIKIYNDESEFENIVKDFEDKIVRYDCIIRAMKNLKIELENVDHDRPEK